MRIDEFKVNGYRSIRDLSVRMRAVNLIVGANGVGKTNLYRSLYLLHAAAKGQFSRTIADEGGITSVFWAGSRRKGENRVTLSIELETLAYELSFGFPSAGDGFAFDPEVKTEKVWLLTQKSRVCVLDRTNSTATLRDAEGNRVLMPHALSLSESALSEVREPARFPELSALRQEFEGWRFYHQFRTDIDSPLRKPQLHLRTLVMAHDGSDWMPALRTIQRVGDADALMALLTLAFPGVELLFEPSQQYLSLMVKLPGATRPFMASELSDGTIHFFALAAAMLSPRPPALLAINEPEASLHADLYPALAELIVKAAASSHLWITTHSERLVELIEQRMPIQPRRLIKIDGETKIEGVGILGERD